MPELLTHPSPEELAAFGLGSLDDPASEAVLNHLAECEECQEIVAATPGDTFTELLAGAKTVLDEPPPGAALPPELAAHPRYTPLRLLGVGGMGTVWLAEHAVMGRRVAVKIIRPEFLARPGAAGRFRREVAAAARLHHPNIVTAFDAGQAGDAHFLAMEFVEGVGLDELLKERGALPVAESCRYARDAAAGLEHAHRAGLVHRDVKPGNLMRAADGTVKVLDFGLAMLVADDRTDTSLTGANMVVGTPDYIAPEQAEHPHAADARADIYALGCTLYHLLTGTVPFPGSSVLKKLDAHRRDQPKPLSRFRADIPHGLPEIVMKMMAKDPAGRFPNAAAVAEALRPHADATAPPPPRPGRLTTILAGVLFAGLVLAGGVIYRIQTDKGELVIATESDDVEVIISQAGKLVTIIDTKTKKQIELKSGEYDLELSNAEGLKLDITKATLTRGGKLLAKIERVPADKSKPRPYEGDASDRLDMSDAMPGIPGSRPDAPGSSGSKDERPSVGMPSPWPLAGAPSPKNKSTTPNGQQSPGSGRDPSMTMGPPAVGAAGHWPPASLPAANGWMSRLPIQHAESEKLRFSPDSRLVGFLTHGNSIELLETATGKLISRFRADSQIHAWAFTPDSARIVVVCKPLPNTYQFDLWRPATREQEQIGEPIRLPAEVRGVFVQKNIQKLVLETPGEYLVYDTAAKAVTRRVSAAVPVRAGTERGWGSGPMPRAQTVSRFLSADAETLYSVVIERLEAPPVQFAHHLTIDRLNDEEAGTIKIALAGEYLKLFDIPRPPGGAAFGVACRGPEGEISISLYDTLGKPAGVLKMPGKVELIRDIAAYARRAVINRQQEKAVFESVDLTDGFPAAVIAKIPNQDATAISADGRVFAARTETGWNLYRLPEVPATPVTPLSRGKSKSDDPVPSKALPVHYVHLLADGLLALNGQGTTLDKLRKLPAGSRIDLEADKEVSNADLQSLLKTLVEAKFEVRIVNRKVPSKD